MNNLNKVHTIDCLQVHSILLTCTKWSINRSRICKSVVVQIRFTRVHFKGFERCPDIFENFELQLGKKISVNIIINCNCNYKNLYQIRLSICITIEQKGGGCPSIHEVPIFGLRKLHLCNNDSLLPIRSNKIPDML
jgi:hypothetical protein